MATAPRQEAQDMSPWFEAILAKYGYLIGGLLIGTGAKYGLLIGEGRQLTWRMALTDALLAGLVALISVMAVEQLGLTGSPAMMMVALIAISSDRVVRIVRDRFMTRLEAELRQQAGDTTNDVQTCLSGREVIRDIAEGTAPDEYEALKPKGPIK